MVWPKALWFCMVAASAAAAVEFHVAPRGSATGTGTAEFPFGTLERAREAVAEAKQRGQADAGVTVWVHGGRYERHEPFRLGATDGGRPEAPVVYQRAPGEQPILSGAVSLPLGALRSVRDREILDRLPQSARQHVKVVNLNAFQISDYGQLPTRFRGAPPVLELFCGGQRMELARWPNSPDWAVVARIVDRGTTSQDPGPPRPGIFKYADPRHANWSKAPDLYLNGYWCHDWAAESIRVDRIDPAEQTVTLAAPHSYGVGRIRSARRYYAFNLLEELDQPGEYYLDRAKGLLYFWPPKTKADTVYLTMLAAPLVQVVGAADLRLEGITFEQVRGDAVEILECERVRVAGCTVRHTGGCGISVRGGSDCRIDTCDVYDTGTGGILLEGGDPKTLAACGHRATNNHIHHFARRQRTYAPGIQLNGVGLRADHNLIHDAPHSAILCGANDCLIEYNEVHDVCLETDDCGAFYKGRNPARQGNVIRYNFWHHIGTPLGHGNNAIYLDDGDVGETVFGNVFYKAGRNSGRSMGSIFTHGGHANVFENNLFIACDRAIGHSHWSDEHWRDYFDPAKNGAMRKLLLEDVDITSPAYLERYPSLHDFFTSWQRPRLNVARNNVAVHCGELLGAKEFHEATANLELTGDPGFADARNLNFLLKPDSPVFSQLPDFRPIPFAVIGLKRSPLRRRWPVRHLPTARPEPVIPEIPRIPLDRFVVPWGSPPRIDGALEPTEWAVAGDGLAIEQNVLGGRTRYLSRAWLRWDKDCLCVAFDNRVSTEKPMATGNNWGLCDAVEIAMARGNSPTTVLRGYTSGYFEGSPEASKDESAAKRAEQGVEYAAKVLSPGKWTCEWRIPWTSLAVKPGAGQVLSFNLSTRKTATDEWAMLRATGGSTWMVSEAALLTLGKPPAPPAPAPKPVAKPPQPEPAAPTTATVPEPQPPATPKPPPPATKPVAKPAPVKPPVRTRPDQEPTAPMHVGPPIKVETPGKPEPKAKPPAKMAPPAKPEKPKEPAPLPVKPPVKAKPEARPTPPARVGPPIQLEQPKKTEPTPEQPAKAAPPVAPETPGKPPPTPVKTPTEPAVKVAPPAEPEKPKEPAPLPVKPPVKVKPEERPAPPARVGPPIQPEQPKKIEPVPEQPAKVGPPVIPENPGKPTPTPVKPPVVVQPGQPAKPSVRIGPPITNQPPEQTPPAPKPAKAAAEIPSMRVTPPKRLIPAGEEPGKPQTGKSGSRFHLWPNRRNEAKGKDDE